MKKPQGALTLGFNGEAFPLVTQPPTHTAFCGTVALRPSITAGLPFSVEKT